MTDRTEGRDLLYGLEAIAEELGLTVPQAKHLARNGSIPTWKEGRIVCARRSGLARHFAERERMGREMAAQHGAGAAA